MTLGRVQRKRKAQLIYPEIASATSVTSVTSASSKPSVTEATEATEAGGLIAGANYI